MIHLPRFNPSWLPIVSTGFLAWAGPTVTAPEEEVPAEKTTPLPDNSPQDWSGFRLQGRGDTSSIVIHHSAFPEGRWILLLPEYIYPDEKGDQEAHQVRWESNREHTHLAFHWDAPEELKKSVGLDFWGELTAHEQTIDFSLTGKNVGTEPWKQWRLALICLQSGGVPTFHDYYARRTFAHQEGQFVTMHEILGGKFADHRMAGVGQVDRLAAKISKDRQWVLGLAVDLARSLSFNFQIPMSCIHSNPSWPQPNPGEEVTAKGKIYLLRGTLEDLWQAYVRDFEKD